MCLSSQSLRMLVVRQVHSLVRRANLDLQVLQQIETAIAAGMDAVQPKPFRIPELMERMHELRKTMEHSG